MAGWKQSNRVLSSIIVCCVLAIAPVAVAQTNEGGMTAVTLNEAEPPQEIAQQVWIMARAGIGGFTETHLSQDSLLVLGGIEGIWYPANTTRVSAEFTVGSYDRQFRPVGVGIAGQVTVLDRQETSFEGNATCGFNTLYFTPIDLFAYAGWRHVFFRASGFDKHLSGGVFGLQLEVPIVQLLGFQAFVDHTFNLLSLDNPIDEPGDSVVGNPEASMRFGGGFRFMPGDFIEVGLSYEGNWMPYEYSDLLLHQVMVEAGYIIRF